METMIDQKIQAVHKHLDAFKLRVLALPTPVTNLSSIWTELASLQDNIDSILATPAEDPKSAPPTFVEHLFLHALLSRDAEK